MIGEFRLEWTPTNDAIAVSQSIFAREGSAEYGVRVSGLAANAQSSLQQFTIGASVDYYIRTYGDNGTQNECAPFNFIAANLTQVGNASGLKATFVRIVP